MPTKIKGTKKIPIKVTFDVYTTLDSEQYPDYIKSTNLPSRIRVLLNAMMLRYDNFKVEENKER
jgi:hypothetical protein